MDSDKKLTTWGKEFEKAAAQRGESLKDIVYIFAEEENDEEYPVTGISISPEEALSREFDSGWGLHEGVRITIWTKKTVYFPIVYDGSEWLGWIPRDPCDLAKEHQGGE